MCMQRRGAAGKAVFRQSPIEDCKVLGCLLLRQCWGRRARQSRCLVIAAGVSLPDKEADTSLLQRVERADCKTMLPQSPAQARTLLLFDKRITTSLNV